MIKYLIILVTITACKPKEKLDPPPWTDGKCLVDSYLGRQAQAATCDYIGYRWNCKWTGDTFSCTRGPESAGERPIIVPPVVNSVPAPADALLPAD